jgi:hypothetical protein
MNPVGDALVDAVAHRNQLTCDAAGLNAPFTTQRFSALFFTIRALRPSMPTGRGELALKPCAGQHARPARRTVPSCTRRAGLFAPRNVALGRLARAAQTRAPHIVDTPPHLRQPRRYFTTLRFEMALQSADKLSRETSKTGLRPVGRAAVAAFETGLRPVRSAPSRNVVTSQDARPARRPVSGCRRRAGLFAPRNVALGLVAPAAQTHPPATVAASIALGPPRRQSPSLHLEMAFRSSERSSRETSKTGLRPVGRAAVAAFERGLRPVRSAPTGRAFANPHARPLPARPSPPPPSPRFSRWTSASSSATIALPNNGRDDLAQQLNTSSDSSMARARCLPLRRSSQFRGTPQQGLAPDPRCARAGEAQVVGPAGVVAKCSCHALASCRVPWRRQNANP